ncbi:hypothetical protein [Actinacidiphila rubida]|uniref:Uncharacterized protein n=1 Tax=Actinacidiphila rubida TaxID=310780 RepID=A0A1H8UVK6_9ACTN|nr:hypothetical protein [Actinacidiphila rubida]SEP07252.1 hypothetical protein SAMN05216267_10889 [Actinacidiphila rubida]
MTGRDGPWTALVTTTTEAGSHLAGRHHEPLEQGLTLIALTEDDWNRIGGALAADPDSAAGLDWFMATVMRSAGFPDACTAPVLFIEVDGDLESSVLVVDRKVTASFAHQTPGPDGPVNSALRRLGVQRGHHPDERTALGLRLP